MHINGNDSPVRRAEPLLLVREISHRVFNEYSQAIAGIRAAATRLGAGDAQTALSSAANRLLNYAAVHRSLLPPPWTGEAGLADYLETVCSALSAATLQERGVRLTLTADQVSLPADRCWRVALIVSELIANAVRHGLHNGPGHVVVAVELRGCDVACLVIDDGRGSPDGKPGHGSAVTLGLAEDLGGIIGWHFSSDGTTAELIFPRSIQEQRS